MIGCVSVNQKLIDDSPIERHILPTLGRACLATPEKEELAFRQRRVFRGAQRASRRGKRRVLARPHFTWQRRPSSTSACVRPAEGDSVLEDEGPAMRDFSKEMRQRREREILVSVQMRLGVFTSTLKQLYPSVNQSVENLYLAGVVAVDDAVQQLPNRVYAAAQHASIVAMVECVGQGNMIRLCQRGRVPPGLTPSGNAYTVADRALQSAQLKLTTYGRALCKGAAHLDLSGVQACGEKAATRCLFHMPDSVFEHTPPVLIAAVLGEVAIKAQYDYVERRVLRRVRAASLPPQDPREPN